MDGLSCENCRQMTTQFTILECDHVVCAQCLWSQVKTSLQGMNTIICQCGTATIFMPDSKRVKEMPTSKVQSKSQLRTSMMLSSRRAYSSSRKSQVHEQTQKKKINTQLQFLEVQFKKTVEEAEHNFRRVIHTLKEKFTNLIIKIRTLQQEEVLSRQSTLFGQICNKNFKTTYQQSIGIVLKSINENFLTQLTMFRLESKPSNRILSSSLSMIKSVSPLNNKENSTGYNYEQQKRNLLKAINNLKQRHECMRKIGRRERPFFQRV